MATSIPESYNQRTKCNICKCKFSQVPKLLKCFHSFCKECLRVKMYDLNSGDLISCPECCTRTIVPVGGVNALADDFLQETKQKLEKLHDGKVKFCNVCEFIGEEILAFHFCINCQYHLCDRDKKKHKATPSQRDHCVISYEEMTSGKYDPEIIESSFKTCKEHVTETVNFYCRPCEALVCHECILAKHRGHKLSSIQEVSNGFQDKIIEILEKVIKAKEEKMERMKTTQRDIDCLVDDKKKLITKIEKRGDNMVTAVHDLSQTIIDNVQRKFSSEEEKCERALKTVSSQSICMENIKSFIEKCMKYSSDVFITSHQEDISKNAESCLSKLKTTPYVSLKSFNLVANDDSLDDTLRSLFGEIKNVRPETQILHEAKTQKIGEDDLSRLRSSVGQIRSAEPVTQKLGESATLKVMKGSRLVKNETPQSKSLASEIQISLSSQLKVPGIIDVTVIDTGDIIVMTSLAVQRLVDESSFKTIYSASRGNMCDMQSYKNNINISVRREPRGVIVCDIEGNVRGVIKVPEQENVGVCGVAVNKRHGTLLFGSDNGKIYQLHFPYYQAPMMFGLRLNTPTSLCCDSEGNCIISDRGNHNITKFDSTGKREWVYGSKGNAPGQFDSPRGICVDDNDYIYVADHKNQRVHILSPDSLRIRYFPCCCYENGESTSPTGVHYRQGKLYVASKNPDMLTVYMIGKY